MEGTLVRLCHPHLMDKIGAPFEANNDETLHYEVINDKGEVSVLEGTGLFMPDLKCRILIPQDNFIDLQRLKRSEVSLTLTWDKYFLNLSEQVPITIHYDQKNHFLVMRAYKSMYSTA